MKRVKFSSEQVKDNSTIKMTMSTLTSMQYNDMKKSSAPRNCKIRDDNGIKVT